MGEWVGFWVMGFMDGGVVVANGRTNGLPQLTDLDLAQRRSSYY